MNLLKKHNYSLRQGHNLSACGSCTVNKTEFFGQTLPRVNALLCVHPQRSQRTAARDTRKHAAGTVSAGLSWPGLEHFDATAVSAGLSRPTAALEFTTAAIRHATQSGGDRRVAVVSSGTIPSATADVHAGIHAGCTWCFPCGPSTWCHAATAVPRQPGPARDAGHARAWCRTVRSLPREHATVATAGHVTARAPSRRVPRPHARTQRSGVCAQQRSAAADDDGARRADGACRPWVCHGLTTGAMAGLYSCTNSPWGYDSLSPLFPYSCQLASQQQPCTSWRRFLMS